MLSPPPVPASTGRRLSRRTLLRVGALALGSLSVADILRARAAAGGATTRRDTAVIHIFMGGGPSHIDLYDLKPDAPAEIRGEFKPISTKLAGVQIGQLMPHLSKVMDRVALVRSVAHSNASHLPASHWMMTGHNPPPSTTTNVNPYAGAVAAKLRGPNVPDMPAYVSIPRRQLLGGAAYLGPAYNPFTIESDPNSSAYSVRNLDFPPGIDAARLEDRRGLLTGLDRWRAATDRQTDLVGMDKFSREAIDIITSPRARQAFDLNRESAATRERYGRTFAGQSVLLARRLVEGGAMFVTVLSGGEWDTHRDNFTTLKSSVPAVEQAIAALVDDLYERSLDRRVLLLVSGEFGRTPKINEFAGRDHWPGAFSVLFAGGGLRVGQVVGATDRHALYPTTHPYSPGDVLATIYDFLGIDPAREFHDRSGRPMRILSDGRAIPELLA